MATERGEFSTLNLGILDTQIVGDYEAAEEFLSGAETLTPPKKEEKKEEKLEDKKDQVNKDKDENRDPFDELDEKEEEEEEEKEEEVKEEDKKEEHIDDTEFEYGALAKDLLRLGIFTQKEEEDEIKTPEELLARFQEEKQMGATQWLENFLSKFGDDRRDMFQAIFIDGADPKEYLPVFNQVQAFETIDITSEENQKIVFREYYKRLGWEADKVEKKLQKTIDYGDLEDESSTLKELLVDQDKKELERIAETSKAAEENQKKADAQYKSSLQKTLTEAIQKREFRGFPITEKKANEVFNFLYAPKYKTNDGKLLTEFDKFVLESKKPENISERILVALMKTENFDFSKIEKNAISKESRNLFSEVAQKVVKSKTRDITKLTNNTNAWSQL